MLSAAPGRGFQGAGAIPVQKGKFYVTVGGAEKLQGELRDLEARRAEVAQNIRHAKGFGDLSENFEYHEAKREQGMLEGRLQQLKIIVPDLMIVRPEDVDRTKVGFGAVVSVREETGDLWDLTVVGPLEADPMADRISYESPLGAALMGRAVGEVVIADVPAGKVEYEIVAISAYDAAD
jgi:transcription elongation factor GreA